MSLLDDFAKTCVILEKRRVSDGAGGYTVTWTEGPEFLNYRATDSSLEAQIAEKQGVTGVYTVLVRKSVPIEYHDVFRDRETGRVFRVTSDPTDHEAPKSASFDLKYCKAERWELPDEEQG